SFVRSSVLSKPKMKVIVFLLVATLSLLVVNASVIDNSLLHAEDIQEHEYSIHDTFLDFDPISGIFTIVKTVVKTVKGISCTIGEVFKIITAGNDFLAATTACGGEINKDVQNLIDAVHNVIVIAEDVVDIGVNICLKDQEEGSIISGLISGPKCALKLTPKLTKFTTEVISTLKLVVQIKDIPGNTGKCTLNAITNLGSYFTEFVPHIKSCAELPAGK
ncbi:hypothetical protein DOY81_008004, partial [Sarcophaga bullata]